MKDGIENEQLPEEISDHLDVKPEPPHNTKGNSDENIDSLPSLTATPQTSLPIELVKNDTMEVPHHGHVHEQKKWKEYVFQFFMLFLAVFCGFLSEYQLEQTIERHREKEYIESYINDLKSDSTQIQFISQNITKNVKGIDSLLTISKDLNGIQNIRLFCYYYITYVPAAITLVPSDGTIQQLKNAGGLRLIKNKEAVDSIMLYESYNRVIERQATRYTDNVVKALDASDFVFDWRTFDGITPKSLLTSDAVFLAKPTKEQLQYFINKMIKQKGTSRIYQRYLEDQYQRGKRILPFLQKEYGL